MKQKIFTWKKVRSVTMMLALTAALAAMPATLFAQNYRLFLNNADGTLRNTNASGAVVSLPGASVTGGVSAWTLTLTNFSFLTTAAYALEVPGGTTIVLNGTNRIESSFNGSGTSCGIYVAEANGQLTITGNGSLSAIGYDGNANYGIYTNGPLTFSGDVNVTAIGGLSSGSGPTASNYGINVVGNTIYVRDNAEVTAKGRENIANPTWNGRGMNFDDLQISDNGKITATGNTRSLFHVGATSNNYIVPNGHRYWTNTTFTDPGGAGSIGNGTTTTITGTHKYARIESPGPAFVPVTDILGIATTGVAGTPLTLGGTVDPATATNQTIVWSLQPGSTAPGAAVSAAGVAEATGAGGVNVRATITDGTDVGTDFIYNLTITFSAAFVPVTDILGIATTGVAGTPLTLGGTVDPATATNQTIVWSLLSGSTAPGAAVSATGVAEATGAGDVEVRATITDGTAVGTDYTKDVTITFSTTFVPVTDILGIATTGVVGTPVTLGGTVDPATATNQTIVWSLRPGSTAPGAAVSAAGVAEATGTGDVYVRATITDGTAVGTDYTKDVTVTFSAATPPAYMAYMHTDGKIYENSASGADITAAMAAAGAVVTPAASGSPGDWILTLTGFTFETTANCAFVVAPGTTVVLNGANTITGAFGTTGTDETCGLFGNGDLYFSGAGSLTVTAGDAGANSSGAIYIIGHLTVSGSVTVNATGGPSSGPTRASAGIYAEEGVHIKDNATVNTTGGTAATSCGIATGPATGSGSRGKLVISGNGTLTATGDFAAIGINGLPGGYTVPAGYTYYVNTTIAPSVTPLTGDGSTTDIDATHLYARIVPGAQSVPDMPTGVVATPGNGEATVVFLAPGDGGNAITGYTVVFSDGTIAATGAGSPITVPGLTNGTTYTLVVFATNGIGSGAASLPVSVTPSAAPFVPVTIITGVTTTGVAGTPVTLSGTVNPATATNQAIVWSLGSGSTATGAAVSGNQVTATGAGTVVVTATVINGLTVSTNYTQNFTITFTEPTTPSTSYTVTTGNFAGGSVSSSHSIALEGATVTLTATPSEGYELVSMSTTPSVILGGSGNIRSFTMPASDVTVHASFTKTAKQLLWEQVMSLIENATFTVPQEYAANEAALAAYLANLINQLLQGTGFTVTAGDIVIFLFTPATAGDASLPAGANGVFGFRVSPSGTNTSAYNDGTITAARVDNESVLTSSLKAWTADGALYVAGLTAGETWRVYNLAGTLIYTGVADGIDVTLPLPGRGVYIVTDGNRVIKVVN